MNSADFMTYEEYVAIVSCFDNEHQRIHLLPMGDIAAFLNKSQNEILLLIEQLEKLGCPIKINSHGHVLLSIQDTYSLEKIKLACDKLGESDVSVFLTLDYLFT